MGQKLLLYKHFFNTMESISLQKIKSIIESNKGSLLAIDNNMVDFKNPDPVSNDEKAMEARFIGNYTKLKVLCSHGHICDIYASKMAEWCTICKLLSYMRKYNKSIQCAQTDFDNAQSSFEFTCAKGHRFMSDRKSPSNGCRSCALQLCLQKKFSCNNGEIYMDKASLFAHNNSKIRFHCDKLIHDPNCANTECVKLREAQPLCDMEFAPDCTNFRPCNQDFYTTPQLIKFGNRLLPCDKMHRWSVNNEIVNTIRALEVLFDCRFDNTNRAAKLEFTAYNSDLRIAAIHMADKLPSKYVEAAITWCGANGTHLLIIPAEIVDGSKIAWDICRQLFAMAIIPHQQHTLTLLRTKIKAMNKSHILFCHRAKK
jgi:hypothetical protein